MAKLKHCIRRALNEIREDCLKEQYWNALAHAVTLFNLLMLEFDKKLKNE